MAKYYKIYAVEAHFDVDEGKRRIKFYRHHKVAKEYCPSWMLIGWLNELLYELIKQNKAVTYPGWDGWVVNVISDNE